MKHQRRIAISCLGGCSRLARQVVVPAALIAIHVSTLSSALAADPVLVCANLASTWVGNIGTMAIPTDMSLDAQGNVLLVGRYDRTVDFDPTARMEERTWQGGSGDAYAMAVAPDGALLWVYTPGGPGLESGTGIAAHADGTVCMVGAFGGSIDFDPTDDIDVHTAIGDFNVFLTKLTIDGTYIWTITLGQGDTQTTANALTLDPAGNSFIVGSFIGTADFDPGEETDLHTSATISGVFGRAGYITKLAPNASYRWTRTLGTSGFDVAKKVATAPNGDVYVVGSFRGSVDFDTGPGAGPARMNR